MSDNWQMQNFYHRRMNRRRRRRRRSRKDWNSSHSQSSFLWYG